MTVGDVVESSSWAREARVAAERHAVHAIIASIYERPIPIRDTAIMMIHGHTQADIAHRLGKSPRAVHYYVHTLRATLASLLEPDYA
jgi:DNA-directed RNA polymerase specialized sigma24 family protein